MIVYIDVLFGVNVLMDYITLLAASRLGGVYARRLRLAGAALLGGAYAAAAALCPALTALPLRVAFGIALCAAAFAGQPAFARLAALYFLVAAAFAGLAMALGRASGRTLLLGAGYYAAVPFRVLLLAAALGYAVSGVLLRGDARHGAVRREIESVQITLDGRTRAVRLLRDTGNTLCEPVSGRPAVVLSRGAAEMLLGGALPSDLHDAASVLAALPPALARRCGLLPYCAVGTAGGLLLYFRPDRITRADGSALDCVCAVGPDTVGQGSYEGLIGV